MRFQFISIAHLPHIAIISCLKLKPSAPSRRHCPLLHSSPLETALSALSLVTPRDGTVCSFTRHPSRRHCLLLHSSPLETALSSPSLVTPRDGTVRSFTRHPSRRHCPLLHSFNLVGQTLHISSVARSEHKVMSIHEDQIGRSNTQSDVNT